jgi:hypothetical protein
MGINVYTTGVLIFLESTCVLMDPQLQVKALCEKAKEILMEESNVQVSHTAGSFLTVMLGIFQDRCECDRISLLLLQQLIEPALWFWHCI